MISEREGTAIKNSDSQLLINRFSSPIPLRYILYIHSVRNSAIRSAC